MINENQQQMIDNAIDLISEVSKSAVRLDTAPPLVCRLESNRQVQFIIKFHIDEYGWRAALNTHLSNVGKEKRANDKKFDKLPGLKLDVDTGLIIDNPRECEEVPSQVRKKGTKPKRRLYINPPKEDDGGLE